MIFCTTSARRSKSRNRQKVKKSARSFARSFWKSVGFSSLFNQQQNEYDENLFHIITIPKNTSTMHSKNNFGAKNRNLTMHSTMHSGGI